VILLGLGLVAFALLIIAGQMHIANEIAQARFDAEERHYAHEAHDRAIQLTQGEQQSRTVADLAAAQHRALGQHERRHEDDD
jgi:hypothetical protein